MTIQIFWVFATNSRIAIHAGDPVKKPIAEKILSMIDKYDEVLCSKMAQVAKKLDPIFGSDILTDSVLIRKDVKLPSNKDSLNIDSIYRVLQASGFYFIRQLLEEDSTTGSFDDKVICFFRNTAISDKRADPFLSRKTNERKYPHAAVLARDILPVSTSSVASKEIFFKAGNLITSH